MHNPTPSFSPATRMLRLAHWDPLTELNSQLAHCSSLTFAGCPPRLPLDRCQTWLGTAIEASCYVGVVQAKEIELGLRSGVHTSVSWSLNVLTVLSFNAPHQLVLSDLPELLQALLQVHCAWLHAFTCSAVLCEFTHKSFVQHILHALLCAEQFL